GDKLDSGLRDRLRSWLRDNPQLGLAAGKWLEEKIPRLPVVFASGLSTRSADAIVGSMSALGVQAVRHEGMAIGHALVRQKAKTLTGRVALIALTSMSGMWNIGSWALAAVALGAVGAVVATTVHSARAVTRRDGADRPALGPALRQAFDRVEQVVPAMPEARHRHALRAVVRQSLDLREQLGASHAEDELAGAVVQASATTASLARIDAELRTRDLNDGGAETRALLHRRDQLAGRMAELSGSLETLRIRLRSGALAREKSGDDEALADLRLRVEALEEVQSL
ncbi:MAG: hypothetical protein KC457_34520, partial [Myxococcales bacterium]|nr:hypothetical protein [Myxococcales bacterium]